MNQINSPKNKKYILICLYTISTICISAFLIKAIWYWDSTINAISNILEMLSPFLIGIFIAYIMNPLVNVIDKFLFKIRLKKTSLRRGISIFISYIVVLGIIAFCISVIIPELYLSLKSVYSGLQKNFDKLITYIDKLNEKYPEIDISFASKLIKDNSSNFLSMIQNSVNTLIPMLYGISVIVIKSAINIIIAIMVSCYMLIDKKRLLLNFKKIIFATLKKERAEKFITTLKDCNKIFGQFVIGKTIDSTIIGFLCFFFMKILRLDYTMLISVIVGITNMIPYFGPYIGAIPGILILLTISWKHALVFSIMILILQQFDGLYLGPKILGQSTGLRPVWIIFAITVGGWLFGPVGMFLGVPTFGIISYLFNRIITKKLHDKQITIE